MDANTLDQGFVAAVRRLLGWLVVLGCAAILLPCPAEHPGRATEYPSGCRRVRRPGTVDP
jgi:hypothetical protein